MSQFMTLRHLSLVAGLTLGLLAGQSVLALSSDRHQSIIIHSDSAERDETKGTTTYSGNVVMQQGSMRIEADEVVIVNDKSKVTQIVATGKPARYQQQPEQVSVESVHSDMQIVQHFYELREGDSKTRAVQQLLAEFQPQSAIIFCNTKQQCHELSVSLRDQGVSALALHGDLEQKERDQVLVRFANKSCSLLVATDVAARGIDIKDLDAVINLELAHDAEVHIHRIGRTGRAGRSGKAFLFVAPRERRLLQSIEKTTGKPITQMDLPTRGELIERRSAAFKEGIAANVKHPKLGFFHKIVEDLCAEHDCSIEDVAAAMAYMLQKERQ